MFSYDVLEEIFRANLRILIRLEIGFTVMLRYYPGSV